MKPNTTSHQARSRRIRRLPLLAVSLMLFGLGCNLSAPAAAPTPEVLVVVVTSTGQPVAANTAAADTQAPTATATQAPPTDTPQPTPTPTITLTPTPEAARATADKGVDVNCRYGPGADFAISGYFMQGQVSAVYGRSQYSTWIQIQHPKTPANKCWVDVDFVSLNVPIASLTELPTPEGFVYEISVSLADKEIHCGLPNPTSVTFKIKVSGPATVKYTFTNSVLPGVPINEQKVMAAFGTIERTLNFGVPSGFGDFTLTATVTAPNSMTRSATGKSTCP